MRDSSSASSDEGGGKEEEKEKKKEEGDEDDKEEPDEAVTISKEELDRLEANANKIRFHDFCEMLIRINRESQTDKKHRRVERLLKAYGVTVRSWW